MTTSAVMEAPIVLMSAAVMLKSSIVTTSLPLGAVGKSLSTLKTSDATAVIFLQDAASGARAGPHRATHTHAQSERTAIARDGPR